MIGDRAAEPLCFLDDSLQIVSLLFESLGQGILVNHGGERHGSGAHRGTKAQQRLTSALPGPFEVRESVLLRRCIDLRLQHADFFGEAAQTAQHLRRTTPA